MLKFKHFFFVLLFAFKVPLIIAYFTLKSFNDEIDDDFKWQVILQKLWLGNNCPIDTGDAS